MRYLNSLSILIVTVFLIVNLVLLSISLTHTQITTPDIHLITDTTDDCGDECVDVGGNQFNLTYHVW